MTGSGHGTLERAGWFTRGYVLKQESTITARIGLAGWFTRRWRIDASATFAAEDLLLIGLVYMTILRRDSEAATHHHGNLAR